MQDALCQRAIAVSTSCFLVLLAVTSDHQFGQSKWREAHLQLVWLRFDMHSVSCKQLPFAGHETIQAWTSGHDLMLSLDLVTTPKVHCCQTFPYRLR